MKAQIEHYPVPPRQLNPAIPEVVEQAIWRSIQKDPVQRFQSASDFRAFLLTAGFAATGKLEPLAVGDPNPYATRPLNTQPPVSNPNVGFATVPSQSGFQMPAQPGTPSNPGLPTPSNPGVPPTGQHASNPGADPLGATLIDAQPHASKETRIGSTAPFAEQQPSSSSKETRIGTPQPPQQQQQQQFAQQFPVQPQFAQQQGFRPGPQQPAKKKGLTWIHFAGAGVAALFLIGILVGVGLFVFWGRKTETVKPSALNQPSAPQPTAQATEPSPQPTTESASQPSAPPQNQPTSSQPSGGDSAQTPPAGYVPITPTDSSPASDKQTAESGRRTSTPRQPTAPTAPPKARGGDDAAERARKRQAAIDALNQ
jgi:serine/threonine-protein kinase